MTNSATQYAVEQFYYLEARLLSERRFEEWLDLLTDDIDYWMPTRETVDGRSDAVAARDELAIFDDDKTFLTRRVERLRSSLAHAEQPPSRLRYYVTNVEVEKAKKRSEYDVRCNLLVYQSRLERTETLYAGRREDRFRKHKDGWRIAARKVVLDQTMIPRTISIFF
jgi:biphenyl 2,3-dioxygenase beta subunit